MNWEQHKVNRKTPYDFCYVYENGKTIPLFQYLSVNQLKEEQCGLVALNHFKNCFSLYYDYQNILGYHGIITEKGNNLKLSSVSQDEKPLTILSYNEEGFSAHCREYNQYNEWLTKRNTQRYVDINNHGQQIDGKNLLHCRRLLDIAIEIATEGTIHVRRPNIDELLKIRRGEIDLKAFMEKAESEIALLTNIYANSNLPDGVDMEFVNSLLLEVRETINY